MSPLGSGWFDQSCRSGDLEEQDLTRALLLVLASGSVVRAMCRFDRLEVDLVEDGWSAGLDRARRSS